MTEHSKALGKWREKLDFLMTEEATEADPARKFQLSNSIAQARKRIAELSNAELRRVQELDKFSDLINEWTRDYTGGAYLRGEVERFLEQNDRGYLLLDGDGGIGKTAFLADYARSHPGFLHHFNQYQQPHSTVKFFVQRSAAQLIVRYDLREPIPDDEPLFWQLLRDISRDILVPTGGKLVFLVDALDEAEGAGDMQRPKNPLQFSDPLPYGVYFIVSARDVRFLGVQAMKRVTVRCNNKDHIRDVHSYIRKRGKEDPGLIRWREEHGQMDLGEFVEHFAERSENNFLYLRHVFGDPEALAAEELPHGLIEYYRTQWERMRGAEDSEALFCLSALLPSISLQRLRHLVGDGKSSLDSSLDRWRWQRFVDQFQDGGVKKYRIYHRAFKEFLAEQTGGDVARYVVYAERLLAEVGGADGDLAQGLSRMRPQILRYEWVNLMLVVLKEAYLFEEFFTLVVNEHFVRVALEREGGAENLLFSMARAENFFGMEAKPLAREAGEKLWELVDEKRVGLSADAVDQAFLGNPHSAIRDGFFKL